MRLRSRSPRVPFFLAMVALIWSVACSGNLTDSAAPKQASAPNAGYRQVEHALGSTQVPANPQRIVTLDGFALENVLALGGQPVGTTLNGSVEQQPEFLKAKVADVELLGSFAQPNLEKILALKPDLILGATGGAEPVYKQLAAIAPTILAHSDSSDDWKSVLYKHAEALGKAEAADQLMADYNARLERFKSQMGDRLSTTEVSVVRVYPNAIGVYLQGSFAGSILADAGLSRPPAQRGLGVQQQISKERIQDLDGDVIFLWAYGSDSDIQTAQQAKAALAKFKTDPLWSQLTAVEQGKVYEVPGYWIGFGPLAANAVIDDLFEYLLGQETP